MFTLWFLIVIATSFMILPALAYLHRELVRAQEVEGERAVIFLWGKQFLGGQLRWPLEWNRFHSRIR